MEIVSAKKDFEEIYEILLESFPGDELRERDSFISLCENEGYKARIIRKNGKITGFIGAWELEKITFVEYFAIAKSRRGKGEGTKMLRSFLAEVKNAVCLEVEPEQTGEIARRRMAFYEREGFSPNPIEYYQPAYSAEKKPLKLVLMTYPDKISKRDFDEYRRKIYKTVYNSAGI